MKTNAEIKLWGTVIGAVSLDDHTKNISFLMNKQGQWKLSPAYDVSFAFNPNGLWTSSHQMTVNGKRKNFTESDFYTCAKLGNLSDREVKSAITDVKSALSNWKTIANNAGLSQKRINEIWSMIG